MPTLPKITPHLPRLTDASSLKTLVENRTIYNLENCELNLFETYQKSALVPLIFNDLVVTSMLRGKKVMHLFDKPGFDYLPGESVIIPANAQMKIDFPEATLENPTQCLALAIDNQKITDTLNLLNEKYKKEGHDNFWKLDGKNYFFYNNEELAFTINHLIQICKSTSLAKDALADIALQELLVRIIQTQTLTAINSEDFEETPKYLSHIIAYVRQNISNKLSLTMIADTANMSTTSLYRSFKRELGMSPVEFIILERIKFAKKLLKEPNIQIKHVSFEAGFDDCNYFIRMFKQYEGMTPKQYQQQINGGIFMPR